MENLKLYQVTEEYVEYLSLYAPHLFRNRQERGKKTRKFIGAVLKVNGMEYLAPLSSFKEKHKNMKDSLDFIKVKDYAVINLNNMFPIPAGQYRYVDISGEEDEKYQDLLRAEYRYIKSIQKNIRRNASILYRKQITEDTPLTARCNDFLKLEEMCRIYSP